MFQLNPALKDFWRTKSRNKVLFGGRASSKSHDAAGFAVFLARNYCVKIMCARRFQARISESVYALVKSKVEDGFSDEFEILKTTIRHKKTGSEFLFYGIERNLAEIKSTEGVDILWLEEANYITQEQWDIIEPTIRKEGSQVWFIFNPDEIMDFVYDNFVTEEQEDTIVRHINWDENPWLSETMLKIIRAMYEKDPERAKHIYGGVPKTGGDKSVINLEFIIAAIDAHKHPEKGWEPSGQRRTGFDVADDGEDKNAIADIHGNVLMYVEDFDGLEGELLKSSAKVFNHAMEFGSQVTYDSIGVGAHVGSKFKELNEAQKEMGSKYELLYDAFNAGGRVDDPDGVFLQLPHIDILNKDHFANIKAQKWEELATRFRKTYEYIEHGVNHPIDELISICTDNIDEARLKQIKKELSVCRKDLDRNGRFKVESKDDLRERGIKSPNIADAIVMAAILPKRAPANFFDL